MERYLDTVTENEISEITKAISEFFYGCNIPLWLVENSLFQNMIQKLRPAFAKSIPSRKILSTTMLHLSYKNCIDMARQVIAPQSVILIDGWKNSSTNAKTVVSMIHIANGQRAFLNAWDLSGDAEKADKISEIVIESADMAKELYDTEVHAIVSDNASTMVKMGKDFGHAYWHSTCSSHTGNLLAKDLVDL